MESLSDSILHLAAACLKIKRGRIKLSDTLGTAAWSALAAAQTSFSKHQGTTGVWLLGKGILQLGIGLLLDSLGVLKFLNEFHLKHFHLQNFLLLCPNHSLLLSHLFVDVVLSFHLLSSDKLFLLKQCNPLLLFYHLVFSLCVHSSLVEEDVLSLLVLHLHHSLLLHFFFLAQVDGFLYLLSFDFSLSPHLVDLLPVVFLHHLVHS